MAFKNENLSSVANNCKTGVVPALWMYYNEANDTVTTAGYIPAHYGVSTRDQVIVVKSDGTSAFYHATVSNAGVVTLVANA
jgi:hypothetical protein